MTSETCWMYLVRHGATANNVEKPPRLQGRRTDPPLSEEGIDQARRTGAFLAETPIDRVFSSPLMRARQTAEAIAVRHGLEVELVDALVEVDVGVWETLAWNEIEQRYPEAYRAFLADSSVNPYLGGENMTTVLERSGPALRCILEENRGRHVAVVAHNVVNRAWLTQLLGMPLAGYRAVPQDNCGVNLLRYRSGNVKLVTLNGAFHLR